MPLWLVATSAMLTQFLMAAQGSARQSAAAGDTLIYVGEMTKIMLIPIAVEFAVIVRNLQAVAARQANRNSRKWLAAWDA